MPPGASPPATEPDAGSPSSRLERWVAWISVLVLVLLCLAVTQRLAPPEPSPLDAPAAEFSARRAYGPLARLLGERQLPHPTGTAANHALRGRLLTELHALGLSPTVQSGVACRRDAKLCAEVHNVVAIVPGAADAPFLALTSHYDSQATAPGAADDGSGVAILLEIARALRASPPARPVALIFADGEEIDLLGATLLSDEHPLSESLRAVINVEARGSRGPSLMFQSTPGGGWLTDAFARSAARPVATSTFPAVYRMLPNDTDLTVYAERGLQGLNFALLAGIEHYHTPLDRLENLDLRSLQHQGESVLATTRALTRAGPEPAGEDQVYFDVLSAFVVRYGESTAWLFAAASTLLLLAGIGRDLWRGVVSAHALGRGLLAATLALASTALLASLAGLIVAAAGGIPFPFVSQPEPLIACGVCCAVASLAILPRLRFLRGAALFDATSLLWLALGWVALAGAAGTSYLMAFPAALAALTRPFVGRGWRRALLLVPAAGAALAWLPINALLYDGLGFGIVAAGPVTLALWLLGWLPLTWPLLKVRWCWPVALGSGAALCLAQSLLPPFSAQVPGRINLAYDLREGATAGQWLAIATFAELPAELRAAADFRAADPPHTLPPFGAPHLFAAPAPALAFTAPALRASRDDGEVRLAIDLPPEAWAVAVHVPRQAPLAEASWRGHPLSPSVAGGWQTFYLIPGTERHPQVTLRFSGAVAQRVEITQIRLGLPSQAGELIDARAPRAAPTHAGDLTLWTTGHAL